MPTDTFHLAGMPRADGRVYFTSPELPGFRMLVDIEKESFREDIADALSIYYPLHLAAKAKQKHFVVTNDRTDNRETPDRNGYRMVASFAAA
jgi:hypothetical protein